MTDLTPVPAALRRRYLDALVAGRAEAERLGYGAMDDRVFAAFHRALLKAEDEQFEEWRVTGVNGYGGEYDFTWSPQLNPHLGPAEQGARAFQALIGTGPAWKDGPYLHRRTVTRTTWERVEA